MKTFAENSMRTAVNYGKVHGMPEAALKSFKEFI